MLTERHRVYRQRRTGSKRDGGGGPEFGERGAAAPLELVILAPLLILLVVFVLWAGRAGRAVLVADLAAGEAAVAAAVCCEHGSSPEAEQAREEVVEQVLRARPSLDFLCIGGVRPAELEDGGGFVDEAWRERFEHEFPGRASGVGVVGVRLECETDGAVAPLRGLFPTVSFYGQASEVVTIPPRLLISVDGAEEVEGGPDDANKLVFDIKFSAPNTQPLEVKWETMPGGTTAEADDYTPVSGSEEIPEGDFNATIEISIAGDEDNEGNERLVLELELVPSDPCALDVPALANPIEETTEIEIQCDNDEISSYEKPVGPDGMPKPDYWKTLVNGTIINDDPSPGP